MSGAQVSWTGWAADPVGPKSAEFHRDLAKRNALRFRPGLPEDGKFDELDRDQIVARAEIEFVESLRRTVAPLAAAIPAAPNDFIAWFEQLKETGPGQGDRLFPWLATSATVEQMKWFLFQEFAGEAGFEDLLAMTQVRSRQS